MQYKCLSKYCLKIVAIYSQPLKMHVFRKSYKILGIMTSFAKREELCYTVFISESENMAYESLVLMKSPKRSILKKGGIA